MQRSDRTPLQKAVDDVVTLSMKWHYLGCITGDCDLIETERNKVLRRLFNACARLERRKRRNRASTRNESS